MKDREDAYGREVYDYLKKKRLTSEIVERDDGYIDFSAGPTAYFSEYKDWSPREFRLQIGSVLSLRT